MRRSVLDLEGSGSIRSALGHMFRFISGHFDRVDQAGACLKLGSFDMPSGTLVFTDYLCVCKALVACVACGTQVMVPSTVIILATARLRVGEQYPALMPTLSQGDLTFVAFSHGALL